MVTKRHQDIVQRIGVRYQAPEILLTSKATNRHAICIVKNQRIARTATREEARAKSLQLLRVDKAVTFSSKLKVNGTSVKFESI